MKRILPTFLALLFLTAAACAEVSFPNNCYDNTDVCGPCDAACDTVSCDPCDPCKTFGKAFGKKSRKGRRSLLDSIEVYGWLQAGVYANSRGSTTKRYDDKNANNRTVSNLEFGSGNSALLSTVHSTDVQVNQIWLGAKREADGTHGLDWGFGAEVFFGPEAWFAQSWNDAKFDYGWQDGDYYTSIPQLYFQLAYGDWSLKLGKFETVLGYEALRSPNFFFYTHSHLFMMEPYSHTGAFFEYTPNDRLEISFGYVTGGDSSFENAYDDHGFLASLTYQLTKKLSMTYSLLYSKYSNQLYYHKSGQQRGFAGTDAFFHTFYFDYEITDKLAYGFHWNFGDAKFRDDGSHTIMYGIANYLTYQWNDKWGVGFRAEWAHDHSGWVGYYEGDVQGYTLCLNWKPVDRISVRPEIRYDYSGSRPFNDGRNRDQFSGGVCAVLSL